MLPSGSFIGRRGETARRWRRRGDGGLRLLAAMPLGYCVASLWAMALARLLPMSNEAATITATVLAFALCAGFAMWAYAARSGWLATWTLLVSGSVAGAIVCASIWSTGRS